MPPNLHQLAAAGSLFASAKARILAGWGLLTRRACRQGGAELRGAIDAGGGGSEGLRRRVGGGQRPGL
eukprot:2487847-Rhodomonas_salina.3